MIKRDEVCIGVKDENMSNINFKFVYFHRLYNR